MKPKKLYVNIMLDVAYDYISPEDEKPPEVKDIRVYMGAIEITEYVNKMDELKEAIEERCYEEGDNVDAKISRGE